MGHPAAAGVQRQHAPAVQANQSQLAHRWGQPRRAYHVCTRPRLHRAAALTAFQAGARRRELSLLRVPERALHANLAWLLPVHQEFDRPMTRAAVTYLHKLGFDVERRLPGLFPASELGIALDLADGCCRCS